ncbi:MAG: serine/threonine-protein kinase [Pirellulaceae bacterium]
MRDVILGDAVRSLAQSVLDHLGRCATCRQAFDQLERQLLDQVWVAELGQETAHFNHEPGLRDTVQRLGQVAEEYLEESTAGDASDSGSDADPFAHLPLLLRDYSLLMRIGSGGMGLIFKAQHRRLNKPVAIKVLRPDLSVDVRQSFEREIKAMGSVEHPLIARATDAFTERGRTFLVMEYIDGWNLAQVVTRCGPLCCEDAKAIVRQVALAMDFAHLRGVAHGDIKPSNVMLTRDGGLRILDLGLAERLSKESLAGILDSRGDREAGGQVLGGDDEASASQAPLEEDSLECAVEVRRDVVALGDMLFRLTTGKSPQLGASIHLRDRLANEAELRRCCPSAPDDLVALYAELKSLAPPFRFRHMLSVVQGLDRLEVGEAVELDVSATDTTYEIAQALREFRRNVRRPGGLVPNSTFLPNETSANGASLKPRVNRVTAALGLALAITTLVALIFAGVNLGTRNRSASALSASSESRSGQRGLESALAGRGSDRLLGTAISIDRVGSDHSSPSWDFQERGRFFLRGRAILDLRWTSTEPNHLLIRRNRRMSSFAIDAWGRSITNTPTGIGSMTIDLPIGLNGPQVLDLIGNSTARSSRFGIALDQETGTAVLPIADGGFLRLHATSLERMPASSHINRMGAVCFVPRHNVWLVALQGELYLFNQTLTDLLARAKWDFSPKRMTADPGGRWVLLEGDEDHQIGLVEVLEKEIVTHDFTALPARRWLRAGFWRGGGSSPNQDSLTADWNQSLGGGSDEYAVSLVFVFGNALEIVNGSRLENGDLRWQSTLELMRFVDDRPADASRLLNSARVFRWRSLASMREVSNFGIWKHEDSWGDLA